MREACSNEQLVYRFEAVPGAAVDDDLLLAFEWAYVETMRHACTRHAGRSQRTDVGRHIMAVRVNGARSWTRIDYGGSYRAEQEGAVTGVWGV